jgi:hypothetical protein
MSLLLFPELLFDEENSFEKEQKAGENIFYFGKF